MEAYTRWADSAPWSVLSKSGLLSERERLPCVCLVFVLLPTGFREQGGTFQLNVGEAPTQQVWFREVCLWRERPQEWWEHHPGLMALSPLCDNRRPVADVVTRAAQAIRHRHLDSATLGNLLTTLGIFGRLADATLDVGAIIGREFMRDSPLVQEFILEGEVAAHRRDILQVIQIRFGEEAAQALRDQIERITDMAQLRSLHESAIRARRVSQFRTSLAALAP